MYWPITIKFRIGKQTSKPQTNYRCCLSFSYLGPYWLISRNTITFHKYSGVHGFVSFTVKGTSEFDLKIGFCFLEYWSFLFENQI